MSNDYVPGQNDPYQERPSETFTIEEALLQIAQRVAFPTEEVRDKVYAAIRAEHGEQLPAETESDEGDESDPATPPARKVAAKKATPTR